MRISFGIKFATLVTFVASSSAVAEPDDGLPIAEPATNPGEWVLPEDWPLWAWRAEIEGRVNFQVLVDKSGKVVECEVTQSSGIPDMDRVACEKVTERGTFRPPTDKSGLKTEGRWASAVVFKFRDSKAELPRWRSTSISYIIEKDGSVSNCSRADEGGGRPLLDFCSMVPDYEPQRDANGNPVRVKVVVTQTQTREVLGD